LAPALGQRGAADLQKRLTTATLAVIEPLRLSQAVEVEVRYTGGNRRAMHDWLGDRYTYRRQGSGDLGDRMSRASQAAFTQGVRKLAMIGTDCPALTAEILARAFLRLATTDLVLGPAFDGGYYLIGLKRPAPKLFQDIPWGSERVRCVTLASARGLGLSTALLTMLHDIDRPEDLGQLKQMNGEHRCSTFIF
jgi:hypothetical protein